MVTTDYITKTLRDHEVQAKQERAAIDGLLRHASKPVDLPSPDVLLERALDLETLLAADPVRGREELKRLFENGRLLIEPQPEGHYIARGRLFPSPSCRSISPQKRTSPGASQLRDL
jgi:hypothetical protein